jgi:FkbH-like protein
MLKCLVWDLDNTLWDGVLQDDYNVKLNKEMVSIIKSLDERGIFQSIASKNDSKLALKKLEEFNILQYFLYPCCNYNSKVLSIKEISEKLNISISDVAFIDDEPFEIFEINRYIPEVCTFLTLNKDNILSYFNESITFESSNRRNMMLMRDKRLEEEKKFSGSRNEFLMECKMRISVRIAKFDDIERISELTIRTNKINNMHERLDTIRIKNILNDIKYKIYVCELNDIFGYHGMVGVCIINEVDEQINIELFCISCRVEGRGIGNGFLNEVIKFYPLNDIYCKYKPLQKNRAAMLLLLLVGFKVLKKEEEYTVLKFTRKTVLNDICWLN